MTVADILRQVGEQESVALKEHVTLLALARISRYEAECAVFEAKYAESFETFRQRIQAIKHQEDVEADDDLMDWEFAHRALLGWREKLDAIRYAA
ncbi:hypothetical protein SAMN05421644_101106 [Allochromatium warmingii]|uniref:Uncharacterized protein n=1 Tax=Allochromatium warmingii TaxID=61595 RepID=A0A1H3AUP4_ALLWA|nr:hypothetical protein [Allochromatium warmingii]SDX32844.1 hypothetical protein SAMN05421644_101106 [Allochromatium warmingii]